MAVKKTARQKKNQKSSRKNLFRYFLYFCGMGIVLLGFFVLTVLWEFWGPVPDTTDLERIQTATASEVISVDGKTLGRIYIKNRTNVSLDEISPYVIKALIPTEDVRFFDHQGVDRRSLFRVFFKTLLMGDRRSGGGSTLSQQLAKNIYPRKKYGIFTIPAAKLREAIIATRLEKIYNKEEILNLYLNTVPFGEDTYGIEEGAKRFFSKHAAELKIEEAATLVGMLKGPTRYNPRLFPERTLHRRNVVLSQMAKYRLIDEERVEELMLLPLGIKYKRVTHSDGPAPYLRERLRLELAELLENYRTPDGQKYNIYTDGLKIYTTIDSRMQTYAEEAMKKHMTALQDNFDAHWRGHNIWKNNNTPLLKAIKQSDRYVNLKKGGLSHEEIMKVFNKPVYTKLFTWKGDVEQKISPRDSIEHYMAMLNAGVLAMNPQDGQIRAWVGGINHHHFKYDHVTARRQAGSVFKPFVYLAAIRNGVSPFAYYKNERKVYEDYNDWSPRNAEDHYEGYYSMEGALAESVNTIAVQMLFNAGIDNVIDLVRDMGVNAKLPEYPSLALGTANVSLWEMVTAYGTLANGGYRVKPHYLIKVEDGEGNLIHDFTADLPQSEKVLSTAEAQVMSHMLQAVVDDGTARTLRRVYRLDNVMAGKTGTTQEHADGWYMGYSPNLVTGVWVGGEDMSVHFRSLTFGQGAYMALPIYARFIQKVINHPHFEHIRYDHFPLMPYELHARLDIPHYRDDSSLPESLFDLFRSKEQTAALSDTLVTRDRQKKRSKIYHLIKKIFGKKK